MADLIARRVWVTTIGADDCGGPELSAGPCDMCGIPIIGLHMHAQAERGDRVLGFCSEECAGRWVAGEQLGFDRIAT